VPLSLQMWSCHVVACEWLDSTEVEALEESSEAERWGEDERRLRRKTI